MTRSAYVTFQWNDRRVAIPAREVTAIVDHPAVGAMPRPTERLRQVVAWGGELCPLLDAAGAMPDAATPVVVLIHREGNVALRVTSTIEVRYGDQERGDTVRLDDAEAEASVWTRRRILQQLARRKP